MKLLLTRVCVLEVSFFLFFCEYPVVNKKAFCLWTFNKSWDHISNLSDRLDIMSDLFFKFSIWKNFQSESGHTESGHECLVEINFCFLLTHCDFGNCRLNTRRFIWLFKKVFNFSRNIIKELKSEILSNYVILITREKFISTEEQILNKKM